MIITDIGHDKRQAECKADHLLALLQDGPRTSAQLIVHHGHRFSASKRVLVERGYQIERGKNEHGEITWTLVGYKPMVEVTEEMKAAYYRTEHWRQLRREAIKRDGNACIFCGYSLAVEVHHWRYELFAEQLRDLSTVCGECHLWIHDNEAVSLHFPHYVTPEHARLLRSV